MNDSNLEWQHKNQIRHRLQIVDKIFIGRECKGIKRNRRILVNHPAVSREHAVIGRNGSHLEITDLSVNGTWINSVRMTPGSRMNLRNGDIIEIGSQTIKVNFRSPFSHNQDDSEAESTIVTTSESIVTSLVADIREFSGISQDQPSADTFAMIKEVFGSFSDIVVQHNGTIKDYAGDAIFAFWMHSNEPNTKKANLACKAAEEQQHTLGQICTNLSQANPAVRNLNIGWGISTGLATISHYGAKVSDIALVGDCVNLAFRLSNLANKELSRKIVMCAQTASLVQDSISLDNLGPVKTKGRKGKENVFGIKELD